MLDPKPLVQSKLDASFVLEFGRQGGAGLTAALRLIQACAGGSSSSVKVGQLLPLSGPNVSEADDILRGFGLYMDSISWTAHAKKIEQINADESSTPAEGIRQARKLMQYDDVNILTGVFLSGTAYALQEEEGFIAAGVADPTIGKYSSTYSASGAPLDQLIFDGVSGIIAGRQPMSDLDQLAKDWRARGGDKVRAEFQESLQNG